MGIFTYRQTKKTRRAVQALSLQQASQSVVDRELALFQLLPPEGKAEYRAVAEKPRQMKSFRLGTPPNLAGERAAIFRKYDLIP